MNKKSFDKKTIQQSIVELRKTGMSNQDIYNELSQKYYGKEEIAILITKTVKDDIKSKYKIYNNILIGLLILAVIFNFIGLVFMLFVFDFNTMLMLIFISIFAILIKILLIIEISKYNADIYKICGWLSVFSLVYSLIKLDWNWISITNVLLMGVMAFLCFYLRIKMFPDYDPKNLRKDKDGNYILT